MLNHRNQYTAVGLVIMELMIALSLGLLLIAILIELYLASQRSFQSQLTLTEIQNNAKAAIQFIADDILQSGHIGCPRLTKSFPIVPYPPYELTPMSKLTISDSELTSIHAAFPSANLEQDLDEESTLYVSKNIRFHTGDVLIISDCQQAELFKAKAVSYSGKSQKITLFTSLKFKYKKHAEVSHLEKNKFFVAKTGRVNPDGSSINALYVQDIHQYKSELVDGVNKIQFQAKNKGVAMKLEVGNGHLKKIWYAYESIT